MTGATVKWAAERCQKALKELEEHDAETRRRLDEPPPARYSRHPNYWALRDNTRHNLSAQVAETAKALVNVVLKEGA